MTTFALAICVCIIDLDCSSVLTYAYLISIDFNMIYTLLGAGLQSESMIFRLHNSRKCKSVSSTDISHSLFQIMSGF